MTTLALFCLVGTSYVGKIIYYIKILLKYHPIYLLFLYCTGSAITDFFLALFAGQDCWGSFPTCDGECPATLDCLPFGFSCECFCKCDIILFLCIYYKSNIYCSSQGMRYLLG